MEWYKNHHSHAAARRVFLSPVGDHSAPADKLTLLPACLPVAQSNKLPLDAAAAAPATTVKKRESARE